MATTFPPLNTFTIQNPTTNVDTTAVAAGELTATEIGIRADGDATHSAGNYLFIVKVTEPATTESVAALNTALGKALAPGNYWAAARADTAGLKADGTPADSAWSTPEQPFSIPVPPAPVPNPPVLSVS